MNGIGPPLVTPFDREGEVDYEQLRELVDWVERRGVDFLVPCGSTSEAELLTAEERARVVETVADEASVPVVAGTGHPGLCETVEATEAAADAGADAALVVTPFYYDHDQSALAAYYRELAETVSLPVYLYSVPQFTGVELDPETVGELTVQSGIVGLKDSSGSVENLVRIQRRVSESDFDLLVGSASILAQALDAGTSGGILALANLVPERVSEVFETQSEDSQRARTLNAELVEMNAVIVGEYGVPGLKWAMRERGIPAGHPRTPHNWPDADAREHIEALVDAEGL